MVQLNVLKVNQHPAVGVPQAPLRGQIHLMLASDYENYLSDSSEPETQLAIQRENDKDLVIHEEDDDSGDSNFAYPTLDGEIVWSKPVSEIVNFIEPGIDFKGDTKKRKRKKLKKKKPDDAQTEASKNDEVDPETDSVDSVEEKMLLDFKDKLEAQSMSGKKLRPNCSEHWLSGVKQAFNSKSANKSITKFE